ncbi:Cactin [Armadillidium nasatum]|uniref:Splicing factor Cactin n=1 Tax=Armadillidium nasatum TaxID=96803 RepID=A0A5N5T974_9CRUS|nr:Cactin [Armadillidium nasatum]
MGSSHKKKKDRSLSPERKLKSNSSRDSSRSLSREKRKERDKHYSRKKDHYDKKEKDRSYHSDSSHKSKGKKKKKKSSSKRSPSSSSTSSSDESDRDIKFLQKLEEERKHFKEDQKKKKEMLKAIETPEEKRLRRLNKKEAKERKRKEKMGWDNEYLHFTNADNPYGDNNLLDTFLWKKKLDKEGLSSLSKEEIQQRSRMKMEENRIELEKVKKRRQEREQERAEREKMMEMQMRQKEAAQFSEFSRQEDGFQLEQARIRSQIRIQDGRAKPIDLLAQYVSSEGDVTAVDMHEPYTHLTGLTLQDLEDLLEDIKVYQQLEKNDENQSYWQDLTIIVQDELRRLRQRDPNTIEDATSHRQGIHASIAQDVSKIFQNKSVADLRKLQMNIEAKLAGPTAGLDVGYWESLLSQLKAHQARARLRERHRDNLKKKLEMLKAEQGVKEEVEDDHSDASTEGETSKQEPITKEEGNDSNTEDEVAEGEGNNEGDSVIASSISAYVSGRFSPKLLSVDLLEPATVVIDTEEDEQRLTWARRKVLGGSADKKDMGLTAEEKAMQREVQQSMTSDEAQFSVEAKLEPQHFLWADKYRPRKPRYFNRVHTGFEWNKYNQTHYDMDNPPPKIVQGYKFNIFYPDLIDKKKTPQYELIPCEDNRDFALLKFTAGPPYEDIAFKIVNREWEYSYKRGFRCQFHNNIFQLWFHFKRYRYRR